MRATALRRKAADPTDALLKKIMVMLSFLSILQARGQSVASERYDPNGSLVHRAANAGTVITVVVIGVVSLVGILIFAQVEEAIPETEGPLADSQTSILEGFGSSMEFVPIIMLVLLASVVIMIVQRMRG